jgi:hypothetical protein
MRGNSTMKSKRVHGQSANTIMNLQIAMEHCKEPGCKNPVIATRNPNGVTKIRACIEHVCTGVNPRRKVELPYYH